MNSNISASRDSSRPNERPKTTESLALRRKAMNAVKAKLQLVKGPLPASSRVLEKSPHPPLSGGSRGGTPTAAASTPPNTVDKHNPSNPAVAPRHSPSNVLFQPGNSPAPTQGVKLLLNTPPASISASKRATVSPSPNVPQPRQIPGSGLRLPPSGVQASAKVHNGTGDSNTTALKADHHSSPSNVNKSSITETPAVLPSKTSKSREETNPQPTAVDGPTSVAVPATPAASERPLIHNEPPADVQGSEQDPPKPASPVSPAVEPTAFGDATPGRNSTPIDNPESEGDSKQRKKATRGKKRKSNTIVESDSDSNSDSAPAPKRSKKKGKKGKKGKKKLKSVSLVNSEVDEIDEQDHQREVHKHSPVNNDENEGDGVPKDRGDEPSSKPSKRKRTDFHDEAEALAYRVNPSRAAKTKTESETRIHYRSLVEAIGSTFTEGRRGSKRKQADKEEEEEEEEEHDDGTGQPWLRRWSEGTHGSKFWPGYDHEHDNWKQVSERDNPNGIDKRRYPLPVVMTKNIPERYLDGIGYVYDRKLKKLCALNYDNLYEGAQWIIDNLDSEISLAEFKARLLIQANMDVLEKLSDPSVEGTVANSTMKAQESIASLTTFRAVLDVGAKHYAQEQFKMLRCVFARMACNAVIASEKDPKSKYPDDLPPNDPMFMHARRVHTPPPDDPLGYDEGLEMEVPGQASQVDNLDPLFEDVEHFFERTVDSLFKDMASKHAKDPLPNRGTPLGSVSRLRSYVNAVASSSKQVRRANAQAPTHRRVPRAEEDQVMGTTSQPRASQMDEDPIEPVDVPMDSDMDVDELVDNGSPMKDVQGTS